MNHYQELIEKEIAALPFPAKPVQLYEPLRYMLSLGGKRMRPILTLMAHQLFDNDVQKSVKPALAIELFHNFSLIHDDIMDNAATRRGKPTVHEKWNLNVGILSGDAMLVKAYELLCEANPKSLPVLLKMFNQTALEVCEGQQKDMDFEIRNDVTIDEYLDMIALKTAVLLGCALYIGAVNAGVSQEDANHLYAFGKNLGIAFQLQDDLLDAFGDEEKFGKKKGGDIIANKKTFLILKCEEKADKADKAILKELLTGNHSDNDHKIGQILNLFEKYQVKEETKNKMKSFYAEAMQNLEAVKTEDTRKNELRQLADFLMHREH